MYSFVADIIVRWNQTSILRLLYSSWIHHFFAWWFEYTFPNKVWTIPYPTGHGKLNPTKAGWAGDRRIIIMITKHSCIKSTSAGCVDRSSMITKRVLLCLKSTKLVWSITISLKISHSYRYCTFECRFLFRMCWTVGVRTAASGLYIYGWIRSLTMTKLMWSRSITLTKVVRWRS